ncbi:MAG: hypothetical protein JWM28_732 [Chitinophagaceae bacterium]|nr:hypothetical protein [Chitinophagaceae bacterium]
MQGLNLGSGAAWRTKSLRNFLRANDKRSKGVAI